MANEEQLNILRQGVTAWNPWREEHHDVKIDLTCADLHGMDLSGVDLAWADMRRANLEGINLTGAILGEANLSGANLTGGILTGAVLLYTALSGTCLVGTHLVDAYLTGANLVGADLQGANLKDTTLVGATLVETNWTEAILTGGCLYGTSRDDWSIDNVKCDFIYWDYKPEIFGTDKGKQQWLREHRVPKDRDFRPGEFENLYKHLPTFEYYFEHGFTPLDALIMDQVVQAINEQRQDIELKLDSFHSRGQPHATFTVLHKNYMEDALKEITIGYETRLKVLEGQKEQLMQVVKMLGSGNVMLQSASDGINLKHAISPDLTKQVIEFLGSLPELDTEDARRAWIYSVGLDVSLEQQIQFSGSSVQFFQLVARTVIAYGRLADGRLAIEAILDAVKQRIGRDRQQQCDRLIQQVQAEYQSW